MPVLHDLAHSACMLSACANGHEHVCDWLSLIACFFHFGQGKVKGVHNLVTLSAAAAAAKKVPLLLSALHDLVVCCHCEEHFKT